MSKIQRSSRQKTRPSSANRSRNNSRSSSNSSRASAYSDCSDEGLTQKDLDEYDKFDVDKFVLDFHDHFEKHIWTDGKTMMEGAEIKSYQDIQKLYDFYQMAEKKLPAKYAKMGLHEINHNGLYHIIFHARQSKLDHRLNALTYITPEDREPCKHEPACKSEIPCKDRWEYPYVMIEGYFYPYFVLKLMELEIFHEWGSTTRLLTPGTTVLGYSLEAFRQVRIIEPDCDKIMQLRQSDEFYIRIRSTPPEVAKKMEHLYPEYGEYFFGPAVRVHAKLREHKEVHKNLQPAIQKEKDRVRTLSPESRIKDVKNDGEFNSPEFRAAIAHVTGCRSNSPPYVQRKGINDKEMNKMLEPAIKKEKDRISTLSPESARKELNCQNQQHGSPEFLDAVDAAYSRIYSDKFGFSGLPSTQTDRKVKVSAKTGRRRRNKEKKEKSNLHLN